MLNKEAILALAWEHSEGSGNRYIFTEENLFEFLKELTREPTPVQDEQCISCGGEATHCNDCPPPFEREARYMIVKLSKLADDQGDNMDRAEQIYRIAHFGEALVGGVVVEEDWPEHEAVWSMIEARATGKSCPEQKPAAWQLHLPDGRVTLEKTFPSWASDGDGYSIKPLYSAPPPPIAQTAPQPEQSGLVDALRRVKLTDEEARHHSASAVAYWNNAVTACIAALSAHG